MHKFLMVLFFFVNSLAGVELKSRLDQAESGDYIVYLYKSHMTLVRIAKKTAHELVVEEVSAPQKEKESDWQKWIDQKAPGHTSWTVSTINYETGKVVSIYSMDEDGAAVQTAAFQFLPTLFLLKLEPISEALRKKIGPEPHAGEPDYRKLWYPTIIFEKKVVTPPIDALRVVWPEDDSELSGRPIDLYIPQKEALTYLPYWIEVSGGPLKAKIFAIDSGKGLKSSTL